MSKRIALFGGSFNPIHCGHLIVSRSIAERLDLDGVIFLPSAQPPHKGQEALLDPVHRAEMVKLAIAGEPCFAFSDFDMTRKGPSYTIDTVMHFRKLLGPDAALHWIIGADSLAELTTWYRVSALVEACRIVTAARPGSQPVDWDKLRQVLDDRQLARLRADVLGTPIIEVSSTEIRARIRQGLSIRYLVPEDVRAYIAEHGLYRDSPKKKSKS